MTILERQALGEAWAGNLPAGGADGLALGPGAPGEEPGPCPVQGCWVAPDVLGVWGPVQALRDGGGWLFVVLRFSRVAWKEDRVRDAGGAKLAVP